MKPQRLPSRLAPGPFRVIERNVVVTKRNFLVIFAGAFEPIFYLFSIGVGLGQLVGTVEGPGGERLSYAAFVAPALLASSAMNGAVFESTYNVFFRLKFAKVYDAMLATPLTPRDVAAGEIGWALIRSGLYATGFVMVMLAMGIMSSLWGLLAIPAALLIGFAFAGVGMAATTYMKSWQHFDLIPMVTLPLFLFSATFYPLEIYPEWLQTATMFSPLYHAVELVRNLSTGHVDAFAAVNVCLLFSMGAVGLSIASRRLEKLLLR